MENKKLIKDCALVGAGVVIGSVLFQAFLSGLENIELFRAIFLGVFVFSVALCFSLLKRIVMSKL